MGIFYSGSRNLTGTIDLHIELEEKIADFLGKETVLLFSTGYQTAQGIIPTLVIKGEYIISDKDNHACIVAGYFMAKGATANVLRYKHNDMNDLERVIKRAPFLIQKIRTDQGKEFTNLKLKTLLKESNIKHRLNHSFNCAMSLILMSCSIKCYSESVKMSNF